jgi:hypothetical protein
MVPNLTFPHHPDTFEWTDTRSSPEKLPLLILLVKFGHLLNLECHHLLQDVLQVKYREVD